MSTKPETQARDFGINYVRAGNGVPPAIIVNVVAGAVLKGIVFDMHELAARVPLGGQCNPAVFAAYVFGLHLPGITNAPARGHIFYGRDVVKGKFAPFQHITHDSDSDSDNDNDEIVVDHDDDDDDDDDVDDVDSGGGGVKAPSVTRQFNRRIEEETASGLEAAATQLAANGADRCTWAWRPCSPSSRRTSC